MLLLKCRRRKTYLIYSKFSPWSPLEWLWLMTSAFLNTWLWHWQWFPRKFLAKHATKKISFPVALFCLHQQPTPSNIKLNDQCLCCMNPSKVESWVWHYIIFLHAIIPEAALCPPPYIQPATHAEAAASRWEKASGGKTLLVCVCMCYTVCATLSVWRFNECLPVSLPPPPPWLVIIFC